MRYWMPGVDDGLDDCVANGLGVGLADGMGFGSVSGVIVALRLRSSRTIHSCPDLNGMTVPSSRVNVVPSFAVGRLHVTSHASPSRMTTALPVPMVSACGVLPPPLSKNADGS